MSLFEVGTPDTFFGKALQRVYAAFMVPGDKTHVYRFEYGLQEFFNDPEGHKLEDYIYRSLTQALRKMGKQVGGIGMPQLRVEEGEGQLTIIWRIPTRMADVRLHGMIQQTVEQITNAVDVLEREFSPRLHGTDTFGDQLSAIRAASLRLADEGLTFGMIMEANERADVAADTDPPEVPQPGGQG